MPPTILEDFLTPQRQLPVVGVFRIKIELTFCFTAAFVDLIELCVDTH